MLLASSDHNYNKWIDFVLSTPTGKESINIEHNGFTGFAIKRYKTHAYKLSTIFYRLKNVVLN